MRFQAFAAIFARMVTYGEQASILSRRLRGDGYRVVSIDTLSDGSLVARIVPTPQLDEPEIRFDSARSTMRIRKQLVRLSPKEYQIAALLFEAQGSLVRRDTLMRRIWEHPSRMTSNALGVHLHGLRRKISAAYDRDLICTVRGQGFFVDYDERLMANAL